MTLQIGSKAPSFTLFNSEFKEVSLSDFAGKKVVLHFFYMAFTDVCTNQICTLRDNFDFYESQDAQVIAISVDSVYTLAKFKEENKCNFPFLSDFNKEVSTAYGAIYELFGYNMKGVSMRSAFVIDEKGIIQYAEVLEYPSELPNFEAINQLLKN